MFRNLFHATTSALGFEVRAKKNLVRNKELEALDQWSAQWDPVIRQYGIQSLFDVGAHTGQFAAMIRRHNPGVALYCFEPLRAPGEQLRQTCDQLGNAHYLPYGLGDVDGSFDMQRSDFQPSSSMLPMLDLHKKEWPASASTHVEKVHVRRLDDVFASLNPQGPLGMKIDVQGFEDKVITGAKESLRNFTVVVIETSFYPLYESQPLFADIYARMTRLGFVYQGALDTSRSQLDGRILQEDSLYVCAS